MGLMDTLKGLVKGREKQVKQGIDTVSDQVEKRVGPKHAAKVDSMSDKAKDHVDKLAGDDAPARATAATPAAPATPATPATPPASAPGAPPPDAPPV